MHQYLGTYKQTPIIIKVEIFTFDVDKLAEIWLNAWAFCSKSCLIGPEIPDNKKWRGKKEGNCHKERQ